MDFKLFNKAHEHINQASGYTDKLKSDTLRLERQLRSYESDSARLAGSQDKINSLKLKYSGLVDERDQLIMERELMRKRVEKMVAEVDVALTEKAQKE